MKKKICCNLWCCFVVIFNAATRVVSTKTLSITSMWNAEVQVMALRHLRFALASCFAGRDSEHHFEVTLVRGIGSKFTFNLNKYVYIYMYTDMYIYIYMWLRNCGFLLKYFQNTSCQASAEWKRLRRPCWALWICKQIPKRSAPCPISQHVSRTAKKREPKQEHTHFKLCILVWKKYLEKRGIDLGC